jgi:hypothetical protein
VLIGGNGKTVPVVHVLDASGPAIQAARPDRLEHLRVFRTLDMLANGLRAGVVRLDRVEAGPERLIGGGVPSRSLVARPSPKLPSTKSPSAKAK